MRAAWVVQGVGYVVILGALFYLLSVREATPGESEQYTDIGTSSEPVDTDEL